MDQAMESQSICKASVSKALETSKESTRRRSDFDGLMNSYSSSRSSNQQKPGGSSSISSSSSMMPSKTRQAVFGNLSDCTSSTKESFRPPNPCKKTIRFRSRPGPQGGLSTLAAAEEEELPPDITSH